MSGVNTTWWRTHPVGHRLLGVLACEIALAVVPGRGLWGLVWLALAAWLVQLVRRSNGLAWGLLLALTALAAVLGAVSTVVTGPGVVALASLVLNAAVLGLLVTPTVRGWVGRSGLMSLPGEH